MEWVGFQHQNSWVSCYVPEKPGNFYKANWKSIYNIYDPSESELPNKLQLGFSHLREHKYQHNFANTVNPLRSCPLQIESMDHFFLRCQNHILLRTTPLMKKLSSFNSERVSLRQTALLEVIPYSNKKLKGIFTWDRRWNIPEMKFCFAMKKFQFTLLFIAAEIKCNFFSGVVWSSNIDEVIRSVCFILFFLR